MTHGLLNAKQLCNRLEISAATYHRWRLAGKLKRLEVAQPIGTFRYSAARVEAWLAGRSVVRLGRGARS
jgi:predicted site-specific integrase-resolvase